MVHKYIAQICIVIYKQQMNKTIFITGASTGMGKATAKLFQSKGWNVIATMRSPEKETELNELENTTLLQLDVTNLEQINSAVEEAISIQPIDVVFNNAGYGLMGAMEGLTDEQILREINTNLLGVIRVTHAFIPHLRAKKSGLFISTTSMGGFLGFPLSAIYHATKFGIEGWSESMSFELALHNISIKTIAPGAVATDFISRSMDKGGHPEYQKLEDKIFSMMASAMELAITPEQLAEAVYEATTDGKDQIRYLVGEDSKAMYARRNEIGPEEFRKEIRKQFLGN